jgi:hypothetical protein
MNPGSSRRPVISGIVSSSAGPVALARVAVTSAPGPMPDIAALTDSNGRFSFASVGPGRYQLAVYADDFSPGHATVEVADDDVSVAVEL